MRILLEVDACVGHGRCYALDPESFEPDDLGHCIVVATEPSGDALDRARRAVEACPEGALSIED
jgi:ferredoxin